MWELICVSFGSSCGLGLHSLLPIVARKPSEQRPRTCLVIQTTVITERQGLFTLSPRRYAVRTAGDMWDPNSPERGQITPPLQDSFRRQSDGEERLKMNPATILRDKLSCPSHPSLLSSSTWLVNPGIIENCTHLGGCLEDW